MSNIQNQPHPQGATEHLDYILVQPDETGALAQITVVTYHRLQGFRQTPSQVTKYNITPGPSQRDLAAVLSATRLTTQQGILTALTTAVVAADTPTDPAPPIPAASSP